MDATPHVGRAPRPAPHSPKARTLALLGLLTGLLVVAPAALPRALAQTCPSGKAAVTSRSFLINGTQTVSTLRGHVHQGDTILASFTIAPGCETSPVPVSLVSYMAPGPTFDPNTVNQQVFFNSSTATFVTGTYMNVLLVHVPDCYFQVDFATAFPKPQLDQNNLYGPDLVDAANGGRNPCPPG